jgi:ketopantoate reductase
MNICVYGAGAIGGSIAARLFASGEKVSVIARGAHAEAIRERGLTVLAGDSRIEARVRCAGDPAEPGVILNTSPQRNRLVIGAAHDASTQAVADVAALFVRAGYDAPVTPNIRQELWNKLVLYLGVSPVAALTHCALDRLVGDSAAYAMMAGLMREAIAIGGRLGFAHPGDVDSQLGFFRDKPTRPSMLQDFELGREPELAGSILAVEAIAQAMNIRAPHRSGRDVAAAEGREYRTHWMIIGCCGVARSLKPGCSSLRGTLRHDLHRRGVTAARRL